MLCVLAVFTMKIWDQNVSKQQTVEESRAEKWDFIKKIWTRNHLVPMVLDPKINHQRICGLGLENLTLGVPCDVPINEMCFYRPFAAPLKHLCHSGNLLKGLLNLSAVSQSVNRNCRNKCQPHRRDRHIQTDTGLDTICWWFLQFAWLVTIWYYMHKYLKTSWEQGETMSLP